MDIVKKIKEKLQNYGGSAKVRLLKGDKYFNVVLTEQGVLVDNLANQPLLEWKVFQKAIELLEKNDGIALKGEAMGYKLGDVNLSTNTIEGYIATEVYNKEFGESVFRRITPIVNILIWVGVCENGKGEIKLISNIGYEFSPEINSEKNESNNGSEKNEVIEDAPCPCCGNIKLTL